MSKPDSDSPMVSIMRQAAIAAAVGFCLWFNYDSVDSRDLKTLLLVSIVGGGSEVVAMLFRRTRGA